MRCGAVHGMPGDVSSSGAGAPGEDFGRVLSAFFDGVENGEQTHPGEFENGEKRLRVH